MSALTQNMPAAMPFLVQRISFQALPFAEHATETRVESTTACLRHGRYDIPLHMDVPFSS